MSPLPKPADSSRHWRTLACHGVPDLDSSLGLLRYYLDPPANQRSGYRRAMARWEAVDGATEKRAALLAAAFEEALSRLRGWAPYSAVESSPAFAAVGECLFWLVALDELAEQVDPAWRGDSSEVKEQLRGLRCARNAVAHGHSVIAPTGWQPGAELGDLVLGRSRLGAVSIFHWESPDALGREAAGQNLLAKYRDHVAGRPVMPVLEAAFNACRR